MNEIFLFAIIVVAVLAVIIGIWGWWMQMSVFMRYQVNNKRKTGENKNGKMVAEELLKKLGYYDVRVRRTSYLWLLFFFKWGNRYSPRRNTIFLYRNVLMRDTITAVAIATQKVGLVIQHKRGEKQMMFRAKWELWTRLAPNLFLPIIVIGLLLDLYANGFDMQASAFGYITLIAAIISIAYTLFAFIALYLIIPTERRAGELAMDAIQKHGTIPCVHFNRIQKLYNAQVNVYKADFALAVLNLILDILYVAAKLANSRKK